MLLIQSVWSLREGFRFLRLVRKGRDKPLGRYTPRVGLVIPCKGIEADFRSNLDRYLSQQYPDYEVVLVVASRDDPAYAPLKERLAQLPAGGSGQACKASLVVAGTAPGRGEKVNNLLRGLERLGPDVETLAFADIDAAVSHEWLRSLVTPLEDARTTVSTGFRWYLPGGGFVSQLRAAWDTSIATLLKECDPKFAWGGSMAIRAADFRRLRVAERYWENTVSDDYALTRAVRQAGERIVFEPRCLVRSQGELSFAEFLRWTNRQIILTRIYAPPLWRQGLAAHALYGVTWAFGGVTLLRLHGPIGQHLALAGILVAILLLGAGNGWIRSVVAHEMFSAEVPGLKRLSPRYWQLAPVVPWVMLWNFGVAAFTHRIEWRGTHYDLDSSGRVRARVRNDGQ